MSSGDGPGLQNRRMASLMSSVRSTRTRFRQCSHCFARTRKLSQSEIKLIERFDLSQIQVLRKDTNGTMTATLVTRASVLKGKMYRRHARRGLAEGMLGRGVIVCEGVTEKDVVLATADMMEESDPDSFYRLDLLLQHQALSWGMRQTLHT